MGMVVQHNMNALNAYNKLNANVAGLKKASEKLSSGYRINRAGDDAAGLAISEKMRSQIRGLNQAKRNAQDGISMIQTFEGAAQETHTILQRMKELATESANGTYDDPTDRAAIQLEFDQLNDELNQLADTDYNGTIVLNGGVMSDGLTQVNGKFDYDQKASQAADAKQALEDQIDTLTKAKADDIFKMDDADGNDVYNDLGDTDYTNDAAKNLWDDLGLDEKTANIDITFSKQTKNGTTEYTAVSATAYDKDGNATDITSKLAAAQIKGNAAVQGDATGNGGFNVTSKTDGAAKPFVNVVFDANSVKEGDVLTLNFKGPKPAPKAPTNITMADVYEADGTTGDKKTVKVNADTVTVTKNPSVKLHTDVKDSLMSEDVNKVFQALDGAKVEFKAVKNKATDTKVTAATLTPNGGTGIALAAGKVTINGVDCVVTIADGKFTIGLNDPANDGNIKADSNLIEIDGGQYTNSAPADGDDSSYEITLALDHSYFPDASTEPDVTAKESTITNPNQSKIDKLQAELDAFDDEGVSVSDAFDNSKAKMSYEEDIILQTGARSKDAVKFTFNYNTADMGNLTPNLDLSSRGNGLNTAQLSLATAKDANYAIDQIDKAINKTSMVRASFGAIQNRLEYKIENLTTTSENLTEAESNIRDTDMANEMLNYTKFNILQQAAQSMLAQANQQPQGILQLLG